MENRIEAYFFLSLKEMSGFIKWFRDDNPKFNITLILSTKSQYYFSITICVIAKK